VVGGSWEGFIIEQLLGHLPKAKAYFWRTQAGAELDLLLDLHRLLVVYPGAVRYTLRPKVEVMSLAQCAAELA
jgi:uncharacterized protein